MLKLRFFGAIALLALAVSARAQGGFTEPAPGGGGGVSVKMGKPDPKRAAKFKAERERLLKDLKLTPAQKSAWDALEKKSKGDRMAILKQLQSGGGDSMALVQKLQTLGETETKGKRAILSDAQKKIFDRSPAAKGGMIRTKKTVT